MNIYYFDDKYKIFNKNYNIDLIVKKKKREGENIDSLNFSF